MIKQDTPSAIRNAMLHWYDDNRRDLPWRSNPGQKPNPYHVWLSEIMLQQTTVGAVKSYFEKFTSIWPTINDLADADIDDVMREWAGLGYYSRARNLHKCANVVVNDYDGIIPNDKTSLLGLPGIGEYTASAIQSIAFDTPSTVIDGNVDRVVSRLYAIDTPLPKSKPLIREYAQALFEGNNLDRPSCFAQSMMDLGATVCIPKTPRCASCPVRQYCAAYEAGNPAQYPFKEKKKPVPEKHAFVFLNINDGQIEIEKRDETGMLGGMMGFPTSEWVDKGASLPDIEYDARIKIRHVFTHFALTLYPVIQKQKGLRMVDFDKVDDIGFPTLFAKVWKLMKSDITMLR